jgi:short-subunit dehydrogenase
MGFPFSNGVAVITGAGKGIGAALAHGLAARHCHLALIDSDAEALARVVASARQTGVTVSSHQLDIANVEAVEVLPQEVLAHHRRVNILINNAGVALMGSFAELRVEDMEWLFAVNFWGTVRMCHAFLGALRRESAAQIVNLSSVFGIIAPAGQTAYGASKFAVRGFSDALREELRETGIGVSVVHPGGIKTTIAASARVASSIAPQDRAERVAAFDRFARTTAVQAATRIIEGIDRRKTRILIGSDARQFDWLQRLFPGSCGTLLRWRARRRRAAAATAVRS